MATVLRANHEHPHLAALGAALLARLAVVAHARRPRRRPWPVGADLFDVFDDDDETAVA